MSYCAQRVNGNRCDPEAALYWRLEDPDGDDVFPGSGVSAPLIDTYGCDDAGPYRLAAGGRYTLTVYGDEDATGSYTFRLRGDRRE